MIKHILTLGLMIATIGCNNLTEPTPAPAEWMLVSGARSGYFHGLDFVDQDRGWAVGDSGKILNTTDGGKSWSIQQSGTLVTLRAVSFLSPSKGWVCGGSNSIGMSTNGGATWTWDHPIGESLRTFMAMSFVDERTGWVVDNFGGILHTENGGSTWTPQASGTSWAITSIQFLDAMEGWACATNRVVLHTTNGGNNWATRILGSLDYGDAVVYTDIYFATRTRGYIATRSVGSTAVHQPPIVTTTDGGETWICRSTPEQSFVQAVAFTNEHVGWGAASSGILHTEDAGTHWTFQVQLPDALFVDVCFIDQVHGWALSFTGEIYRYQGI
jgi:photosystem II stability/assembly factor-like uncharacterized protein